MDDPESNLILTELRKISKLLVLNLNQDRSQNELIAAMSKIGFQPKEIAELLGTTSNTVSVAKAKAKSKSNIRGGHNDQQGTSQETS